MSHNESDLTGHGAGRTVDSLDDAPRDSVDEWGVFASTTEALTLTILTELLRRTSEHPEVPDSVSVIFDGVYAAELDHWLFTSKHWGSEHHAVLDPGRVLRRRRRCARPDGGRQGSRGRRAPVRQHVSARGHDVRGRRGLNVRALRGRARRERVRTPRPRANARRRKSGQRPRIRGVRIRSRQPDRDCRQERWLWLRRAGDGRRSLLRPSRVADGPAHPDQLEPTAIGRTRRKPGPAGPRRLQFWKPSQTYPAVAAAG
jgi:hypothetical protein